MEFVGQEQRWAWHCEGLT